MIGILLVSLVLQFYRLGDWQVFSDDQAVEMGIMRQMLVDHNIPLLGLALSVGTAHIGPLFYYMLALPLWLGHIDPTAGVAMIGLFQVATVYLLYRLCALVDAPWAGLCAAALYATSGLVVYWSRFLWPNVAPFFAVLALYALVALAQGRPRYLVLLAASLACAAQMQPTAILLIPVAVLWLAALRVPAVCGRLAPRLLTRGASPDRSADARLSAVGTDLDPAMSSARTRITPRLVVVSVGLIVLLFSPVLLYDLQHGFAETRAWLAYATTLHARDAPGGGPATTGWERGLGFLEGIGWRAIGFRTRAPVDLLLLLATLAVVVAASGLGGRKRALLSRLLLLWGGVYLAAMSVYHGTLHTHYAEPLFPWPFLAIGLLLDLTVTGALRLARLITGRANVSWSHVQNVVRGACYAGTAILALGLATANARHLWANHFGLDPYLFDNPADTQGSMVMLDEMRQATRLIARDAGRTPYSFLVAVRDGAGGGYQYLQQQSSAPPAPTMRPLQYLLVEPPDSPPWLWPAATRERWRRTPGGFVRLPHLLLWRLRPYGAGANLSWRAGAQTRGPMTAVAVLGGDGAHLLGGFAGGVATAIDGGRHWRQGRLLPGPRSPEPTDGLAMVSSVATSPLLCPRRLYAGTYDGVIASRDDGATWRRLAAQPAPSETLSLLTVPWRCDLLLAGLPDAIARSVDGGRTWQRQVIGHSRHLGVYTLVPGPNGRMLYAGTTDGVWQSRDDGRSWQARYQAGEPQPAFSLIVHPSIKGLLLAGSGAHNGLVSSTDGGVTWTGRGDGLHGLVYALLLVDGKSNMLAGSEAGLYLSHDDGATWVRVGVPPDLTVSALAKGSPDGRLLYAATNKGLYRSTDGGATWAPP